MIKMEMKKIIGLMSLLAVVAIGVMIVSYGGFVGNVMLSSSGQEVEYSSMVCVYLNGNEVFCKPNTLTALGKNMTRDRLTGGAGAAVDYIGVGNSTGVNSTSPSLEGEISDCGLDRAQDTSVLNIDNGNWSYNYKFTSTCSGLIVNTTGIFNHTSANDGFLAGATFSSSVTLQTNDELNVTWYVFVT